MKLLSAPRVKLFASTKPRTPKPITANVKAVSGGIIKAKAPGAMPGIDTEADTLMHQVPGKAGHFQYK